MAEEKKKRSKIKVEGMKGLHQGRPRTVRVVKGKDESNADRFIKKNPPVKDWRRKELYLTEEELDSIYIKPQFDVVAICQAYCDFYNGKTSYAQICRKLEISKYTLKRYFAKITYERQKDARAKGVDLNGKPTAREDDERNDSIY